jgi:hypothetical protein
VKGLGRRRLITSTLKLNVSQTHDKSAREVVVATFENEFRVSGFPLPLDSGDLSDLERVASYKKRLASFAEALIRECDKYDLAEHAWAAVYKRLTKGPWENHPSGKSTSFFPGGDLHTAGGWLGKLSEVSPNTKVVATKDAGKGMLNAFLFQLDPKCDPITNDRNAIVVLCAASKAATMTQQVSVVLLLHLLRNSKAQREVAGEMEENGRFVCLKVNTTTASPIGRLLQGFQSLSTSESKQTRKCLDALITIETKRIRVAFQATMDSEETAKSVAESLNKRERPEGTITRAIHELDNFTSVSVKNDKTMLLIWLDFDRATIE